MVHPHDLDPIDRDLESHRDEEAERKRLLVDQEIERSVLDGQREQMLRPGSEVAVEPAGISLEQQADEVSSKRRAVLDGLRGGELPIAEYWIQRFASADWSAALPELLARVRSALGASSGGRWEEHLRQLELDLSILEGAVARLGNQLEMTRDQVLAALNASELPSPLKKDWSRRLASRHWLAEAPGLLGEVEVSLRISRPGILEPLRNLQQELLTLERVVRRWREDV